MRTQARRHGEAASIGTAGPTVDPRAQAAGYDYERYSTLAGPMADGDAGDGPQTVRLKRPPGARPRRQWALAAAVMTLQTLFLVWLLQPAHRPALGRSIVLDVASVIMIASIYCIELFRFVNVSSLCLASALARDPVPLAPQAGTRVAFLTSIVPSREPVEVVRRTLEAALCCRHDGPYDVWLLDEEDDPSARAMCRELGVRHFSRCGVERFNQPAGRFKARTKHGNYNSWVSAHGGEYEFFVSVDPDHVPLPNFCERLLGYFRDPEVAFVVGPQVYGNFDNFVTKGAESQQFVFHGLIQRLGNFFGCPMLVGTNNAIRISALEEIGGLRDSITEDLSTSLAFHSARWSGSRRWRSVYTPDVLAVGEGPANFTDFFSQQHRWSRGTFETFRGHYWSSMRGLGWGPRLHYALITSYYPSAAIGWILGGVNCVVYLVLGARGIQVTPRVWLAVYLDLAIVQLSLYASNRRYNVSPHEAPGSSGAIGMLMSVMAAPIYVAAFIQSLFGVRQGFVVTPKGDMRSSDRTSTFRLHLGWAAAFAVALVISLQMNRPQSSMRLWSLVLIGVCLLPWLLAALDRTRGHHAMVTARVADGARGHRGVDSIKDASASAVVAPEAA